MASLPKCEKCGRQLNVGDDVYEREVKVIDLNNLPYFNLQRRYRCAPKCP